jgi:long-chain acyl-CoA synthetase
MKLAHGEYVSLGHVETALLQCPLVDNICVYAPPTAEFLIALVVPNPRQLEALAEKVGVGSFTRILPLFN